MNRSRHRNVSIRVVGYDARWRSDFARLNQAWLRRYFRIEPIDAEVLDDPETRILSEGGEVLFAIDGDMAIGTCALMYAGDGMYELTKMAVDESRQGEGIGRLLLTAAIDAFRMRAGRELFLETNSALVPAIALYESAGFVHQPAIKPDSHYERADVYMIWQATHQAT